MFVPHNGYMRTMSSGNFLAGLAVGAITTFVLTNPDIQRALFRTVAKTSGLLKSGMAEAKERFNDAEAEVQMDIEQEPEQT